MRKPDKKILVVEDVESMLYVYGELLGEEGFKTILAKNVPEAMARLDQDVGLVITDFDMPGADGLELAQTVKSKWRVPILLVTALHVPDTPFVDAVIFKPFSAADLCATVRRLMKLPLMRTAA